MSLAVMEGRHESFIRMDDDEPLVNRSKPSVQPLKSLMRSGSIRKIGNGRSADTRKLRKTKSSDSTVTTQTSKIKGILKKQRGDGDGLMDMRSSKKKKKKELKGDDESFVDTRNSKKKNNKSTGDEEDSVNTRRSNKEYEEAGTRRSKKKYEEVDIRRSNKKEGNKKYEEAEDNKKSTKQTSEREVPEAECSFESEEDPFTRTKEIRQLVKFALKKTDSKGIVESVGGKSVLKEIDLVAVVAEALQYHHEVLLCQDSFANYDELPFTFLQSIVCVFVSHLTRHVNAKKTRKNRNSPLRSQARHAPKNRGPLRYSEDEDEEEGKQRLEDDLKAALSLLDTMRKSDSSIEVEHEDVESACSTLTWASDSDEAKFYKAVSDLYCGVLDSWDGGCGWVLGENVGKNKLAANSDALNNSMTYEDHLAAISDLPEHGDSLLDSSEEYALETSLLEDEDKIVVIEDTVKMTLGESSHSEEISSPTETYEVDPDFQPQGDEQGDEEQVIKPSISSVVEDLLSEDIIEDFADFEAAASSEDNGPPTVECAKNVEAEDFLTKFSWDAIPSLLGDLIETVGQTETQPPEDFAAFEAATLSKDNEPPTAECAENVDAGLSTKLPWDATPNGVGDLNETVGQTETRPPEDFADFETAALSKDNGPSTAECAEDVDAEMEPEKGKADLQLTKILTVKTDAPAATGYSNSFSAFADDKNKDPEETSWESFDVPASKDDTALVTEWNKRELSMESIDDTDFYSERFEPTTPEAKPTVRISIVEGVSSKKASPDPPKVVVDMTHQETQKQDTGILSSYSFDALKYLSKGNDKPDISRVRSADDGFNTPDSKSWFAKGSESFMKAVHEPPKGVVDFNPRVEKKEERGIFSSFSFDALKSFGKGNEPPEIPRVYSSDADGFNPPESKSWFAQDSWFQNGKEEPAKSRERRTPSPASVMNFYRKAASAAPPCKYAENDPWSASPQLQMPTFSM